MLQKIVMVLLTLFTMIASSVSPANLLSSDGTPGADESAAPGTTVLEEVFTKARGSGHRFAKVSVLSVTVDGRDVFEDAWGQGTLKEVTFKVGVKRGEGNTLSIGGNDVELRPTDVISIRNFRGKFEFKDVKTSGATLALDGTVETTLVAKGELVQKVKTQMLTPDPLDRALTAPDASRVDLAYIELSSGKTVQTVSWETGLASRLYTWGPESEDAEGDAASVLAKWIKIDGREIKEYTWGDGTVARIEFEPTERSTLGSLLNWSGTEVALQPRKSIVIENFVGSYTAFEAVGGGMKLRLDGYAGNFTVGEPQVPRGVPGNNLPPEPRIAYSPSDPSTSDYVTFQDLSVDPDGLVVFREWWFEDTNTTSILPTPKHKFTKPGVWEVTLEVTDNALASTTVTEYVTVTNTPPVSDWDFNPKDVFAGQNIRFEDKSWDPDDADGPVSRVWDLGDGSPARTEAAFTHSYAKHGNYTVTLTVTDAHGETDALSKVIMVRNRPPFPEFTFDPQNPLSMEEVAFTDLSRDEDGYLTCWEWEFGDGSNSIARHPNHTYESPGTYFVNLTVCDDGGGRSSTGQTVAVLNRAPIPDFKYAPTNVSTSTTVQFTDLSEDLDGQIVEWRWDFGDGTPPDTRRHPTHRFFSMGVFNTCVSVRDDSGDQQQSCRDVPVNNSAPSVRFRWTPNTVDAPITNQSVSFTDQTTDPDGDGLASWEWSFGDGSGASTDRNPVHRFTRKGDFLVTLRVTDAQGKVGSGSNTLTVHNDPPTVAFTYAPTAPTTADVVAFTANATDSDGSIASLEWSFGDGSPNATGTLVTHRFSASGTYRVTLKATDNDGGTRSTFRDVQVVRSTPQPNFTWSPRASPAPHPGELVQFTDTTVAHDALIVNWTWTFGDSATSTQQNPTHTYASAGTYTVRLRIREDSGTEHTVTHPVRVNAAPLAAFTASTTSVNVGDSVTFTDASTDPDGSVEEWTWDFGDGSPTATGKGPHEHTFSAPGTHTVRLTVRDGDGATASATKPISVANRGPTADFDWVPSQPQRAQPVQFSDLSTDPDAPHDAISSWQWDFGQGVGTRTEQHPVVPFPTSGIKTVTLTVSDGALSSTRTKLLRVTSDQDHVTRICSELPDGRLLDHSLPTVSLDATLTRPAGWGAPVTFEKDDDRVTVDVEGCLRITLAPPDWANGDVLHFNVTVGNGGGTDGGIVQPGDDALVVNRTLEIALPLDPTVRVLPGERDPLGFPPLDLRKPDARYNYPTYVDQTEAVRVAGHVEWRDGHDASGVDAHVMIRYIGLRVLQTLPETLNNPVTGWCQAADGTTDANGNFTASLRYTPSCVNLFTQDGLFLPGWYQVRVVAACDECSPAAVRGTSPFALFYEDPLGIVTGRVGFPDPA